MRLLRATVETLPEKIKLYFAMNRLVSTALTHDEFERITAIPPLTELEQRAKQEVRDMKIGKEATDHEHN